LEKKSRFENKVKHLKGINESSKCKGYDGKNFKKQMEKLQKNTKKNGIESFDGTPKPNSMGCCQKEGHKLRVQKFWKENKIACVPTHTHLKIKASTIMNKPLIMYKIHYIC
jgi:hypothetical protein